MCDVDGSDIPSDVVVDVDSIEAEATMVPRKEDTPELLAPEEKTS